MGCFRCGKVNITRGQCPKCGYPGADTRDREMSNDMRRRAEAAAERHFEALTEPLYTQIQKREKQSDLAALLFDFAASEIAAAREEGRQAERAMVRAELERRKLNAQEWYDDSDARDAVMSQLNGLIVWLDEREKGAKQ